MTARRRCGWGDTHPLLTTYHDEEWGVPIHQERDWYGKLVLDGAQAGLSWLTILKKREAYRAALAGFDPAVVARYGARDKARLLGNEGIVRNRLKIESHVANARAFLEVQEEFGSFDAFIWERVGGKPIQSGGRTLAAVPARTPLSDALSKELRQRGFSFVGSTIVYAFMQAAGLVNDHLQGCFRRTAVARLR